MASYKKSVDLMDGDVMIYIIASSKTDVWQVRFKNPLPTGSHYVRKSTQHRNQASATRFALDLYNEYSARKNLGFSTGSMTLGFAVDRFKNEFDKVSKTNLLRNYKSYWLQYFGDKDIARWTGDYIHEYFVWRVKNKKSITNSNLWDSSGGRSVSVSTLNLERNLLRRLLTFCKGSGVLLKVPAFPRNFNGFDNTHSLPNNKRRSRMDSATYKNIVEPYLDKIQDSLINPEWTPQLRNLDLPMDLTSQGGTNLYESRLRRKQREDPQRTTHKIWCHKQKRYNKALFWFFSTLILKCGIRPSEAAKLKNKDIQLKKDEKTGRYFTVVNIPSTVSKVRKHRQAICIDFSYSYEKSVRFFAEKMYRFNRLPEENDWLFPSTSKVDLYDGRMKDYRSVMRANFQKMGIHTQTEESTGIKTFFSSYSLRSYYISMMLRKGIDLYTLSKFVGASPETILKTYDVNENWFLREKMVSHLSKDVSEFSTEGRDELDKFASDWD